ncbi:multiple monosaccharide ABC transporter ATP-binding protein [Tessaracoccus antarcticus]|uniref:ATP-binding cassette domain-containing protein n=1 Tax=Tessaracoccus antarcticus TaxID=2479848 RepID=A0A3M0GAF7_9ACTN|nr:multiple monosaccharide ABC transporter ATP-binding protein [Tessaracoccus antarcticus]RMB61277.1 ATP-binding cassette domain-containing protein [Tessaracoccus antarcticus]
MTDIDSPSGSPAGPILEMRDIVKKFGVVTALGGVSMAVEPGEIHAICGENGAGKSTLMNVLSGLYPVGSYDGEIWYEGELMGFKTLRDSETRGIVIIHQELALSPHLSIAENIYLGNERSHRGVIDWRATRAGAAELLQRVGLRENPNTRVSELGVGKQQLVEIAKALSKDVRLLILDEPTAALNDDDSAHLLGLMRMLKREGVTQIIISHKLNEIMAIADSLTVIRDGTVVETVAMNGTEPVTEERIIRGMVGRSLDHRFPPRSPHIGEELFRLEDWTVHHPTDPGRVIVDRASLSVREGEVVGIAGLMGAGRTELAMSLFGRQYGTGVSGHAYKRGVEIFPRTVRRAIRDGIAYVSEDRKKFGLNLIGEIRHNVTAAALGKVSRRGVLDKGLETKVAQDYREQLRIRTSSVQSPVSQLSGGNQQKVSLSKWMFSDPDVLILDEPTRGIDVGAKFEIYTIINALAAQGRGVIVISSELPELLGLCDRIYTLSQGRITGEQNRAEATQESLMRLMTMERTSA